MTPRPVKLYTVEEQEVMAYDYVSFYRQHKLDLNAGIPVRGDDIMLATTERIDVPVRRFVEALSMSDKSKWKESFIAIDPRLEEMITCKWIERAEQSESRASAAMSQMLLYQDRISDYNDLPWYKRIFRRV